MDSQASTAQRPSFSLTWSLPVPNDSSPHTEHFPACACDTQDNSKLRFLCVQHQKDSQLIWSFWRAVLKCFGQNNQQVIPDHLHDCLSKGSRSFGPGSDKNNSMCITTHIGPKACSKGYAVCYGCRPTCPKDTCCNPLSNAMLLCHMLCMHECHMLCMHEKLNMALEAVRSAVLITACSSECIQLRQILA